VIQLSIVIGICANNYCTFLADQRRVSFVGINEPNNVEDEKFEKIFKIGNNLLLGATGIYASDERLTDAIGDATDIDSAFDNIISYLVFAQQRGRLFANRIYLLGGKNRDGENSLYTIKYNSNEHKIDTQKQSIPVGINATTFQCALPNVAAMNSEKYNNDITECIKIAKTHQEMIIRIKSVIEDVAEVDDTVNKNISVLTLMN